VHRHQIPELLFGKDQCEITQTYYRIFKTAHAGQEGFAGAEYTGRVACDLHRTTHMLDYVQHGPDVASTEAMTVINFTQNGWINFELLDRAFQMPLSKVVDHPTPNYLHRSPPHRQSLHP